MEFDQVTNGPNAAGTNIPGGPVASSYDQQSGVLQLGGKTLQAAFGAAGAQPAVTALTTAQTLYSLALPANMQNTVGRTLRIMGYGIYTSPGTTTPTLTLQIVEGGITPVAITTAALSATASTGMPFNFCFDITTASTGAAGTLEAHGSLNIGIGANTPAAALVNYQDTNVAVSSAINLNAANTLLLQVAASLTVTSVQLRQITVELVS